MIGTHHIGASSIKSTSTKQRFTLIKDADRFFRHEQRRVCVQTRSCNRNGVERICLTRLPETRLKRQTPTFQYIHIALAILYNLRLKIKGLCTHSCIPCSQFVRIGFTHCVYAIALQTRIGSYIQLISSSVKHMWEIAFAEFCQSKRLWKFRQRHGKKAQTINEDNTIDFHVLDACSESKNLLNLHLMIHTPLQNKLKVVARSIVRKYRPSFVCIDCKQHRTELIDDVAEITRCYIRKTVVKIFTCIGRPHNMGNFVESALLCTLEIKEQ